MSKPELNPEIIDEVPWSETVTDYDRRHLIVYLQLLDADAAGASDEAMSKMVLGIDPMRGAQRSRNILASHLRRAKWMVSEGFRHLLEADAY
jgi:hypothetical protein